MSGNVSSTVGKSIEFKSVEFIRTHDYLMLKRLGEGACGATALLRDEQIGMDFVCKKYAPQNPANQAKYFENFVREVKLLYKVCHPNVVRIFNSYLYPESHRGYILMEFVDGVPIDLDVLLQPERLNSLFVQTIDGFAHLESLGILHRDIRPANLMVSQDGLVKIIDFGFGKQVFNAADFDKSITLNWWCDVPQDFAQSRYDFTTEVYFVGKLFEGLIRDNGIEHFEYTELLRQMCTHRPEDRLKSFHAAQSAVQNKRFEVHSFSAEEAVAYREFADAMCRHITKIESGAKYATSRDAIVRTLDDVHRNVMLEVTVPDCALITRCFISGAYYYQKAGFPVRELREFLGLIKRCDGEKLGILLGNLHTRLDSIPRYNAADDDIPF